MQVINSSLIAFKQNKEQQTISQKPVSLAQANSNTDFTAKAIPTSENYKAFFTTNLFTNKTKIGFGKSLETHLEGLGPKYDSKNQTASLKVWAPNVSKMELQIIKIPKHSSLSLKYYNPKIPNGCEVIPMQKQGDVFALPNIDISKLPLSNFSGKNADVTRNDYKVLYRLNISERPKEFSRHSYGPLKDPRGEYLPEGALNWNEFIDHNNFEWGEHEKEWNKPAPKGAVFNEAGRIQLEGKSIEEKNKALASLRIYECNVGLMTNGGTFYDLLKPVSYKKLMEKFNDKGESLDLKVKEELKNLESQKKLNPLSFIKALGYNAIEFMPVNQFSGNFGWGYDNSDVYAIQHSYGGPSGFKNLIKEAHKVGLNVIQDEQHNHEAPEGHVLSALGPYSGHAGEFGGLFNLDNADLNNHDCEKVRDHFVDAIIKTLKNYHVDGIRFDYTKDQGLNMPRQYAEEISAHFPNTIITAEDNRERFDISNPIEPDDLYVESAKTDEYKPPRCDVNHSRLTHIGLNQWNTDFSHTTEALAIGEEVMGHGPSLNALSKHYKNGFRNYDKPVGDANTVEFVLSHDEIGNHNKNLIAKIAAKDLKIFEKTKGGGSQGNIIINSLIDSYLKNNRKDIMSDEDQRKLNLTQTIKFQDFDAAYKRAESRNRLALTELHIRPGGPKLLYAGEENEHSRLTFHLDLSPETVRKESKKKGYDAGFPTHIACKLDNYKIDTKKVNLLTKLAGLVKENEALSSGKREYGKLIKDYTYENDQNKVYEVLRTNSSKNNQIFTILNYGDKDYKQYGIKMTNKGAQPNPSWRLSKGTWEVALNTEDKKYSNNSTPEELIAKEGTVFTTDGNNEIIMPLPRNSAIILKKIK